MKAGLILEAAREEALGRALRIGSPVGDVDNQNYLSFQQPLKRAPPGPFPWGVTSPLCWQDEPGGGRRGQSSRVRLPVGMTSGWLLRARAGLVERPQLCPMHPPRSPSKPEALCGWREGGRAVDGPHHLEGSQGCSDCSVLLAGSPFCSFPCKVGLQRKGIRSP